MKRKLSLLLAVVMILGSFSFAFAAETNDAADFLEEKGVLKGDTTGDLMLGEPLERRDAVVLLSRLMGVEEEAKEFEAEGLPTWKDNNDSYYNGFLAWAQSNEYFKGHNEEKFGPRDNITVREYAVVLLRALGYVEEADDWDKVFDTAKKLGLLEGVEAEADDDVLRGQMAVMTFTALGTAMKDSDETLAEFLDIDMPEPEVLEVVSVDADNLKEVKVVFNKSVDEESVLNLDNYEIDKQEIDDITYIESENTAILLLEGQLKNKTEYTLKIKGVKDDKTTLNVEEKFTAFDNDIPVVEDVVGLGTKAVKVIMSEPVKKPGTSAFKLDGKTVYGTVDVAGREVILRLYKENTPGEYELTVRGLEDYAGYKSLETKHGFEIIEDDEKPFVTEVSATLEKVAVTFSEDIDPLTVNNKTVYWKDSGTKVYPESHARVAGNKYVFVFGGKKALPVYETTLYIEGAADYSGNKMDPAEERLKATIDETRPEVIKVELEDDLKTILVRFSKAVDEEDAKDRDNYRVLDEKDNKQSIDKIVKEDSRTYKVVLSKKLSENKEYTLKISGIKDNNKYANVMVEYNESLTVGDYSLPKVVSVSGDFDYDSDEKEWESIIHVFFNKEMNLGTLSNPDNYLIEIGAVNKLLSDLDGEVDIIKSDGTVAILTVVNKNKVDKVGVLGVEDTTGKKLSNYGEMITVTSKIPALKKNAEATAKDTVKLTFDMPIKEVKDGAVTITDTVGSPLRSVVVKDVEINDDVVTLTVDKLGADAYNFTYTINAKKIIAYNGKAVEATVAAPLTDKIAPSMVSATAGNLTTTSGAFELTIDVKFDEDIVLGTAPIDDFTVKAATGGGEATVKSVTPKAGNLDTVTLAVSILAEDLEEDTAFDVTINEDVRYVLDNGSTNVAKVGTKRTDVVTGIAPVLEAAKIPATLEAKGAVGTVVLPEVAEGFTITATSDATGVYDNDGKIVATGTANVVYTITHTASGRTANTGTVVVTVTVE